MVDSAIVASYVSAARTRKRKDTSKPKRVARVMHITPLDRLKVRTLNVYEHQAADEILCAYAASVGVGVTRDPDLGLPAGVPRFDSADKEAAWRLDLCRTFSRWKSELAGRPEMHAALAVLIEERPLRSVDAEQRSRKGTTKGQLLAALRHFAALRGNTPRGARWKITVDNAGRLG